MNPKTDKICDVSSKIVFEKLESQYGKSVPLTKKQVNKLKPLSKRKRKALLSGMSCPCASGKSFKKCCLKKYQKKKEVK